MSTKYTTEYFISRAVEKYGTRYDYSISKYVGSRQPIDIRCSLHGIFTQTPHTHLTYGGCRQCARDKFKDTTESFILKAKTKHNNLYTYKSVHYISSGVQIIITCRTHGNFLQTPANHLAGEGCKKCKLDKHKKTTAFFVKKSSKQHKYKYDYSSSEYTGNKKQITIICNIHGRFSQMAGDHMRGSGCQSCARQTYSQMEIAWLKRFNNPNIQHAENGGQFILPGTKYKVDGFDKNTNTVYEFYGDVFHGNPNMYADGDLCHPYRNDISAGELYQQTQNREEHIMTLGYTVTTIWEAQFKHEESNSG